MRKIAQDFKQALDKIIIMSHMGLEELQELAEAISGRANSSFLSAGEARKIVFTAISTNELPQAVENRLAWARRNLCERIEDKQEQDPCYRLLRMARESYRAACDRKVEILAYNEEASLVSKTEDAFTHKGASLPRWEELERDESGARLVLQFLGKNGLEELTGMMIEEMSHEGHARRGTFPADERCVKLASALKELDDTRKVMVADAASLSRWRQQLVALKAGPEELKLVDAQHDEKLNEASALYEQCKKVEDEAKWAELSAFHEFVFEVRGKLCANPDAKLAVDEIAALHIEEKGWEDPGRVFNVLKLRNEGGALEIVQNMIKAGICSGAAGHQLEKRRVEIINRMFEQESQEEYGMGSIFRALGTLREPEKRRRA